MIIRVAEDGQVTLEDAYDFRAFSVVGTPDESLGRLTDDDHVFIPRDTVIRLAGDAAEDPAWQSDFSGMVAFADKQGWLDEDGAIRAHVEPAG